MLKVKICGITNEADARLAASMGYDYIGMIFYQKSPRNISVANASKISRSVSSIVEPVGVFVNEEPEVILKTAKKAGLKLIQLHGGESPEYCSSLKNLLPPDIKTIKALGVSGDTTATSLVEMIDSYEKTGAVEYFLLDNSPSFSEGEEPTENQSAQQLWGGTGMTFDWNIAAEVVKLKNSARIFLAGGLGPDNVREAIEKVAPWGVDASSRLERLPRRKDYNKMLSFIKAAQKL